MPIAQPQQARSALTQFLYSLEIAPYDAPAAACYGEVRTLLERKGTPIGSLDTLIAARASALDVPVTHDTREFSRVVGLRVDDWLK